MLWVRCGVTASAVAAMLVCTAVAGDAPPTAEWGGAIGPADVAARDARSSASTAQLVRLDFGVDTAAVHADRVGTGRLELGPTALALASFHTENVPAPGAAALGLSLVAALAVSRKR